MKKVMYVFAFLAISLSFTNCGSDDDDDTVDGCSQSDWVGTYTGTCDSKPISIIVKADGPNLEFRIDYDASVETTSVPFDGCTVSVSNSLVNLQASLNGNTLTYKDPDAACSNIVVTKS